MRNGVRLGRIAGIEVIADWSLLIIFTLIAFGLATGVFPAWHPDWPAALAWGTALASLSPLATLLAWLGPVNLLLAAFNLVPGFPLDGGRVLRALIWGATGDLRKATRWASRGGRAFAGLLVGTGLLMLFGLVVPVLGGGPWSGLWLMFNGWFLNNAALVSYRELVVKQTLESVAVSRLMQTQVARVDPELSVQQLADGILMASGQRVVPVERAGRFLGLLRREDVLKWLALHEARAAS